MRPMKTERRGLNEAEKLHFLEQSPAVVDWKEALVSPFLGGVFAGFLAFLAMAGLDKLLGFELRFALGVDPAVLMLIICGGLAAVFTGFAVRFELMNRKAVMTRRDEILELEDLVVEYHRVVEGKLVHEPEHGQYMFFLRTSDDKTVFVLEGQDVPEHGCTEEFLLHVPEDDTPKEDLKIIRHPSDGQTLFLTFSGLPLSFKESFEIGLAPQFWPESGRILKAPWKEIEARYRLSKRIS